jgi:DNA-binding XRE family transcriptional regulator
MRETAFTIASAMPRKKYGESSFGERLQAIRKPRGLTHVQLAQAAETTQRAISYYETEPGYEHGIGVVEGADGRRAGMAPLVPG